MSPTSVQQFASTRNDRALELLNSGAVSPNGGPGRFYVQSQTDSSQTYHIDLNTSKCDCPDYQQGHICKHLIAARMAAWEQRVCQLSEQAGISPAELKRRIERNVVMNDYATPAQVQAVEAICRLWDRQRAQAVRQ